MSLDVGLTSDVGREREINQDSAGVTEFGDDQLVVVADGMGGHVAGEEAARLVVESLFARFEHHTDADPRDNLYYGILDAHAAVLAYAERHGTEGMGSTVVAALIRGTPPGWPTWATAASTSCATAPWCSRRRITRASR